eukprot:gene12376-6580_t
MPLLKSVGYNAFNSMKGVLTIDAGDCSELTTIGWAAFRDVSNVASTISFGALPNLTSVGSYAFQQMVGVLTIDAGDCAELSTIGQQAFSIDTHDIYGYPSGVSNPASTVSFGALPKLASVGEKAFNSMTGVLTIDAGNCAELTTIGSDAFRSVSNAASTISFGALPKLTSVSEHTFYGMKGALTIDA